jgi:hypothetical protein
MTVNVLAALKRCSASDPRLKVLLPIDPMAYFFTRIFSTRCFRCTLGCANIGAILNRLNALHGQNPIANGGSSFCETLAPWSKIPAVGRHRRTDVEGSAWFLARTLFCTRRFLKRSTSIFSDPLAFFVLPKRYLRKGGVFSARERLHRDGAADTPPPYTETDL